jgi:hypothetical protein
VRYEVRVAAHSGGEATRFELEQDEPLKEDDAIRQFSMLYRVKRVQPLDLSESDEFDAIVEAEWAAGPAQAGFRA